jgi:hypothetical protein
MKPDLFTVYQICNPDDAGDMRKGHIGLTKQQPNTLFEKFVGRALKGTIANKALGTLLMEDAEAHIFVVSKFYDENRAKAYYAHLMLERGERELQAQAQ